MSAAPVPPEWTLPIVRGALGCLRAVPGGPEPVQLDTLAAVAELVAGAKVDVRELSSLSAEELAAAIPDLDHRRAAVALLVTMELIVHPVPNELDESVRAYADALGTDTPMLHAAHQFAEDHIAHMYEDIERQSWYTKETARRIAKGPMFEIIRSKIARHGRSRRSAIAARWRALESCPAGSWGRAVSDFYQEHSFTYPGEKGSIREVGAEHDWVHVLADYPPDPEGEIDVFAFIATSMRNAGKLRDAREHARPLPERQPPAHRRGVRVDRTGRHVLRPGRGVALRRRNATRVRDHHRRARWHRSLRLQGHAARRGT